MATLMKFTFLAFVIIIFVALAPVLLRGIGAIASFLFGALLSLITLPLRTPESRLLLAIILTLYMAYKSLIGIGRPGEAEMEVRILMACLKTALPFILLVLIPHLIAKEEAKHVSKKKPDKGKSIID